MAPRKKKISTQEIIDNIRHNIAEAQKEREQLVADQRILAGMSFQRLHELCKESIEDCDEEILELNLELEQMLEKQKAENNN